jgi:hypothetical protein
MTSLILFPGGTGGAGGTGGGGGGRGGAGEGARLTYDVRGGSLIVHHHLYVNSLVSCPAPIPPGV